MSGLILTITDAGRAALVNAGNTGTNPVLMASVGVSATSFAPSPATTVLPDEIKRISTVSGEAVADDTMHVTVRDESSAIYTVRSFGLYLADGTLFAVYSQPDPIMEKSAQAMLLLAIDVVFADIDATDITFGDTVFLNPPATTERQGVVELATETETTTGTDPARAVTPKGLKAAVTSWLNTRFGEGAPSAFVKGLLTSVSAAALRTSLELRSAALKDEGAGKGLDADLLDGQHGSYYANIPARLGYTPWGPSNDGSGSGLDADTLDGLQAAAFAQLTGAHFTGVISVPAGSGYIIGGVTALSRATNHSTQYLLCGTSNLVVQNAEQTVSILTLTNAGALNTAGAITRLGNTVWDSGNDGSGSGLDADMLDGMHSSAFAQLSGAAFTGPVYISGSGIQRLGAPAGTWLAAEPHGQWSISCGDGTMRVYDGRNNSELFRATATGSYALSGLLWSASNDGAGSGLDADLLDGLQASAFAKLTDFVASKTTNGYCRLPNGMIIQAGRYTQSANSLISVVFPLAFPSLCMGVVTGGTADADFGAEGNTPTVYSGSVTTGGFQSHNANDNGTTAYFIAFGY